MKRKLALLICATMIFSTAFATVQVSAADSSTEIMLSSGVSIKYDMDSKSYTAVVTGLSAVSDSGCANIPSNFKFGNQLYSVVGISEKAFYNNRKITEVSIPYSVTYIGDSAFENCVSLKKVTFTGPNKTDTTYKIGASAFKDCSNLANVSITNIDEIGDAAFYGCTALKTATIKNNGTTTTGKKRAIIYGNDVFRGCRSLTSFSLGDEVTKIGTSMFYGCKALNKISIGSSITSGLDGTTFGSNYDMRNSIERADDYSQAREAVTDFFTTSACAKLSAVNISANNPTYSSVQGCIYNKDQTKLLFVPYNTTIKNLAIPATVKEIGEAAATGNNSVTSLSFRGTGSIKIGPHAFSGSRVKKVVINNGLKCDLGRYAFAGSDLESISGNYTKSGDTTFANCQVNF